MPSVTQEGLLPSYKIGLAAADFLLHWFKLPRAQKWRDRIGEFGPNQYSRHAEIAESSLHVCRPLIISWILIRVNSAE